MQTNTIHNEDCLITLSKMDDGCCDVFTDPKYNAKKNYGTMVNDNLPEDEYKEWIARLFTELKRVGNVVTVYTPHKWHLLYWSILGPGFTSITLTNNAKNNFYKGFVSKTAILLTNAKPEKSEQVENIWKDVQLPGLGFFAKEEKNDHPGYTTLDVTYKVIQRLCKSEIIYDPQMGSGTTALAALMLNKKYIGSELNPKFIKTANNRIKKELGLFI